MYIVIELVINQVINFVLNKKIKLKRLFIFLNSDNLASNLGITQLTILLYLKFCSDDRVGIRILVQTYYTIDLF